MQSTVERSPLTSASRITGVEVGGWLIRHRAWAPVLPAALLIVPYDVQADVVRDLRLGGPLLLLGMTARLLAVGFSGNATRPHRGVVAPLVTVGPYRFVRNPIYLGNILLFTGAVLLFGRWMLAPLLIAAALGYYHAVVLWEEAFLSHMFGEEYATYAARVGRWLPRLNHSVPRSFHHFDLPKALRSERGTLSILGLVLVAYLLLTFWIAPQ
jgi:hypothetical protein